MLSILRCYYTSLAINCIGMRAVKSVLLASGALKRMHPQMEEDKVVLRAIVDVNLPKFLKEDVPLFKGIYADLFPGTELPQPARDDMKRWLITVLKRKKLQDTPWYVEKVLQLYEMMLVRHGLTVVGGTMGGKTNAWQVDFLQFVYLNYLIRKLFVQTLAEALKEVRNDPTSTCKEYEVSYKIINPKAISMGQLYGSFDPYTHEWTDGVLAKTFRDMVNTSFDMRCWIMFDGPIDAVS